MHSIYTFRKGYDDYILFIVFDPWKRYKRAIVFDHSLLDIMWIGTYDDWTPAEQRDWDRDMEENERLYEERQKQEQVAVKEEKKELSKEPVKEEQPESTKEVKETKTWMDWAFEDPLYKATFTRLGDTHAYSVNLIPQTPVHSDVARNLVFEVVNPLYQGLDAILKKEKPISTIKIHVSSREHVYVYYTCYCTPDTWSYTVMDEILEGLNEQLSMKQNLNRGLLIQLSFIKKMK